MTRLSFELLTAITTATAAIAVSRKAASTARLGLVAAAGKDPLRIFYLGAQATEVVKAVKAVSDTAYPTAGFVKGASVPIVQHLLPDS